MSLQDITATATLVHEISLNLGAMVNDQYNCESFAPKSALTRRYGDMICLHPLSHPLGPLMVSWGSAGARLHRTLGCSGTHAVYSHTRSQGLFTVSSWTREEHANSSSDRDLIRQAVVLITKPPCCPRALHLLSNSWISPDTD